MKYVRPEFSRSEVRRAGEVLIDPSADAAAMAHATSVMTNWRAAHGYLLNTFQSTLRTKLKSLDKTALVGQRSKRAPSIIAKLQRFDSMKLNQMQDIAGLRAIVTTMPKLVKLHGEYQSSRFAHKLVKTNDYVNQPKPDGYRSIHLVYRYQNKRAPAYDNLHVELQLRTNLQHAWATAVETVDAFLGEAIKAGRPGAEWANFFKLSSAAFSHAEGTPWIEELDGIPLPQLLGFLAQSERKLEVLLRLRGFRVATNHIIKTGANNASYHLVVLNLDSRRLNVKSYSRAEQEAANVAYAECEERARTGEPIDPVLITGGSVDTLRKSFPNYFLDTEVFARRIEKVLAKGI